MAELPTGTVTFMLTDLEGSTRLWEERPAPMEAALVAHDAILREAVESNRGVVVDHGGDGMCAVFASASDAIAAGLRFELLIAGSADAGVAGLLPRVALHAGEGVLRADGRYVNQPLNRCARLLATGHGGQVLVSESVETLARDSLPPDAELVALGEHRLRDLARPMRVFQLVHPELRREFPPLRSVDAFRGNLPLQMSSFIGRTGEIDQTIAALGEARVVTLTGVGGVGKTRLALQVAAEVVADFREGAWLIELAPVRDPDGVGDAFAAVFGVTARAGQTLVEALVEFLETKQLLLVVDNCEHLLDPVADLVEAIGHSCPGVVVLATSREGLAVPGERILAVPSLVSPSDTADLDAVVGSDAVRLFVERAQAADAAFAVGSDNAASVVRVCRRLDGVPLAIELAAALVTWMSPAELAAALDHRFDLLAGGRRGAVKRQQTLRATIDWSYDLLDDTQRRLLARLSIFAGGCTREAAETVCAGEPIEARAVFGLLGELVARYLVVAERDGLETRYRLSETIREYGEERLAEHGETDGLRDRHARYYAEFAWRWNEGRRSPESFAWGARLRTDDENVLAAFAHAVDTPDFDIAVRLLEATGLINFQSGYGMTLPVETVLAVPGVEHHPGYPLVLMAAAFAAINRGEASLARDNCAAALAAEDALTVALPYTVDLDAYRYHLVGLVASSTGAWDDAAAAYLEGVAAHRRADRTTLLGGCLCGAASSLCYSGRFSDALPVASDAVAVARATGVPGLITMSLVALAEALSQQEPEQARALLDEAAHESLDNEVSAALTQMTFAASLLRDWPHAASLARRAIPLVHWENNRPFLHAVLTVSARALADTDPEAAATIQGVAHTLAKTLDRSAATAPGTNRGGVTVETRHETTRLLTEALGDKRLRVLRDHGEAMDTDTAVAYTLTHLDAFLTNTDA